MEKSRVIFNGYGYTASLVGFKSINGPILTVTLNNRGKALTGNEALEWADHIETALDKIEAAAICRHIVLAI